MIHVISTSANIDENYHSRKQQYLEGLASIVNYYKINPYIIECYNKTNYLSEHYSGNSLYSDNKGINEILNIKMFFEKYQELFNDNDDVIKFTLRYKIISSYFLDIVNNNTHDIYCKYSDDLYPWSGKSGVHTFLISMKYKLWKEFLSTVNMSVTKDHPIECQFAEFSKKHNTNYLNKLDCLAMPYKLNKTLIV